MQLGEVRESGQRYTPIEYDEATSQISEKPAEEIVVNINTPTDQVEDTAKNEATASQDTEETKPKRLKKQKASKAAAASQLIDFLGEMQRQQRETMKQFLEGIQKIEESSRRHTADTLLGIANIFAKERHGRRGGKRRRYESPQSESD